MGVGSCEFESHLGHSKRSVISRLPTFFCFCILSEFAAPARQPACHAVLRYGIRKYPACHSALDAEVRVIPHLMRYLEIPERQIPIRDSSLDPRSAG